MSKQSTSNPSFKKIIQYLFIVLFLSIIGFYLYKHRNELNLIRNISGTHIIILSLLLIVTNIINSYKFYIILLSQGLKNVNFLKWLKIFVISRFINFHVTQGAHLYRIFKLKKEFNFPYAHTLSMTIYFLWIEIVMYLSFAYIALRFLTENSQLVDSTLTIIQSILIITILFPFVLNLFFRKSKLELPIFSRFRRQISEFTSSMRILNKNKILLLKFLGLTLFFFVFQCALISYTFNAIGIILKLQHTIIYTIIFILTRKINIIPGNIGLAEILLGNLSKIMGETLGAGIIVSGIIRIMSYLLLAILFFTFKENINIKEYTESNERTQS